VGAFTNATEDIKKATDALKLFNAENGKLDAPTEAQFGPATRGAQTVGRSDGSGSGGNSLVAIARKQQREQFILYQDINKKMEQILKQLLGAGVNTVRSSR
jgi:hypothetical protein